MLLLQKIGKICVLVSGLYLSACGGNDNPQSLIIGTAWPSCASNDGEATRLEFLIENEQKLVLSLGRPLNSIVGQWNVERSDANGGLAGFLCAKDSYASCTQIQQGVLRIDSFTNQTILGNWQFKETLAVLQNSNFKATVISTTPFICG